LLKALKNGDWILIDEINLASNEMLQKIVPLISGKSITLFEKGDLKNINRHPNFRLLGRMNPGNDFGKKSLPANLLDKFTIFTLPEPDKIDV
jgi:midasin